jgi:hypothetical protein
MANGMKNFLHLPLLAVATACALLPVPTKAQETRAHDAGSSADALSQLLATVPAGRWIDVVNTHMSRVVYNGPLASAIHGNWGPTAIMGAWSGATLDTVNDRLIVLGGGHNDYYGNEVYAFSLKTLEWSRLNSPSSPVGYTTSGNGGYMPDGAPPILHTYDMLAYVPETNQVLVPAGASSFSNGNQTGARIYYYTWAFNLTTNKWAQLANNNLTGSTVDIVFHDNSADHMLYGISSERAFQRYSPATNTWSGLGLGGRLSGYHMTGAIDPMDRFLVAVGSDGGTGFLNVIGLATGLVSSPRTSGDLTVQNGNSPGFVWDPIAMVFVGWNGGSTLYTLDPKTWHWTVVTLSTGNRVTPPAPAKNGTFGRFQYDAAHDVFIVVNDIDQDVYVFKPNFGSSRGSTDANPHP